jgi:hypothetical protein
VLYKCCVQAIKNRPMKHCLFFILTIIISNSIFCQGRFQKLYDGALVYSTSSSFLVVNVINTNTKETKQILCDAVALMNSAIIEQNGDFHDSLIIKKLRQEMIQKDTIFTIELGKKEALEMIHYNSYRAKNIEKISKLLAKGIADSLSNYVFFRDTCYADIKYNCEYDPICKAKKEKIDNELRRRELKFFWKYYSKYGFMYFHALFLNGFSTGMDCLSGSFIIERYEK